MAQIRLKRYEDRDTPFTIYTNLEAVATIYTGSLYSYMTTWANSNAYCEGLQYLYLICKYKGLWWGVEWYAGHSNGCDNSGTNGTTVYGTNVFSGGATIVYFDPNTNILYRTNIVSYKYTQVGMCVDEKANKLYIVGQGSNANYVANSGTFEYIQLDDNWKAGDNVVVNTISTFLHSMWFINGTRRYSQGILDTIVDYDGNVWIASEYSTSSSYFGGADSLYKWNGSGFEDKSSLLSFNKTDYSPYFSGDYRPTLMFKANGKMFMTDGMQWYKNGHLYQIKNDIKNIIMISPYTNIYIQPKLYKNRFCCLCTEGQTLTNQTYFSSFNMKGEKRATLLNIPLGYSYGYRQGCGLELLFIDKGYAYFRNVVSSTSANFNTSYGYSQYWGWRQPPAIQYDVRILRAKLK